MTTRVQAARVRGDFASIVRRTARGERIKLTRYGKTQAVLIPKRDLETLEECEQGHAEKKASHGPPRRR